MDTTRTTRPPGLRTVLVFLVLWLGLGFALLWVYEATGREPSSVFLYIILVGVAGALWLILLVHRLFLRSRLTAPRLTVLNARPRLGEHVGFSVHLEARRPVTVEKVVAVLSAAEEVRGAGKRGRLLPVVVRRIEETLAEKLALEKRKPVDVAGEVAVPPDAMQSFESHRVAFTWRLDVLVFVGRHLTHRLTETLGVQPVRLAAKEDTP